MASRATSSRLARAGDGRHSRAMPRRFTLRQLEYFVAVGQAGSIAAASEAINVSSPSISAAIAQLEAEFGIQLFVRQHAQGLSLTPGGRRFFGEAKLLLEAADGLHDLAADIAHAARGPIGIGCFVTLAPLILASLRRSFEAAHPGVRVVQSEGDQERLLAMLRRAEIDVAITYDLEIPQDVAFAPLASLPPHAMVAADHRFAGLAFRADRGARRRADGAPRPAAQPRLLPLALRRRRPQAAHRRADPRHGGDAQPRRQRLRLRARQPPAAHRPRARRPAAVAGPPRRRPRGRWRSASPPCAASAGPASSPPSRRTAASGSPAARSPGSRSRLRVARPQRPPKTSRMSISSPGGSSAKDPSWTIRTSIEPSSARR